jgi:hypothetical protein
VSEVPISLLMSDRLLMEDKKVAEPMPAQPAWRRKVRREIFFISLAGFYQKKWCGGGEIVI